MQAETQDGDAGIQDELPAVCMADVEVLFDMLSMPALGREAMRVLERAVVQDVLNHMEARTLPPRTPPSYAHGRGGACMHGTHCE